MTKNKMKNGKRTEKGFKRFLNSIQELYQKYLLFKQKRYIKLMVAERSSDKNQPIKHVVMIVPVESYGITQVFGDPPESEKNSFKGDVRADATIERQREANFRRLTRR